MAKSFHEMLAEASNGLPGGKELCDAFARSFPPEPEVLQTLNRAGIAAQQMLDDYLHAIADDDSIVDDEIVRFVVAVDVVSDGAVSQMTVRIRRPQPGDTEIFCVRPGDMRKAITAKRSVAEVK